MILSVHDIRGFFIALWFGLFSWAWTTELEQTKIWLSHLYPKLCLTRNRINSRTIALCRIPSWRKTEPYLVQPHVLLHFQILTMRCLQGDLSVLCISSKNFSAQHPHISTVSGFEIYLLGGYSCSSCGMSLPDSHSFAVDGFYILPTLSREMTPVTTSSATLEQGSSSFFEMRIAWENS